MFITLCLFNYVDFKKFNNIFENTGCFKRKREEKSKRDFNERRTRNRGYAINEMKELNDKEFKKIFRLNRRGFYYLLTKIKLHIEPKAGAVPYDLYHDILKPISAEVKLAITYYLSLVRGGLVL